MKRSFIILLFHILSLQIKGIESKAMPGYGLFRINPFLFQK